MAHAPNTPDRNLSVGGDAKDAENLRGAFDSEPALSFNEASKARIGKAISDAVLPSRIRTPVRRLGIRHP